MDRKTFMVLTAAVGLLCGFLLETWIRLEHASRGYSVSAQAFRSNLYASNAQMVDQRSGDTPNEEEREQSSQKDLDR